MGVGLRTMGSSEATAGAGGGDRDGSGGSAGGLGVVFSNGEFFAPGSARVSAMDAGIQHGVGLFETLLGGYAGASESQSGGARSFAELAMQDELEGTWACMLDEHLTRMQGSAKALGLSAGLNIEALREATLITIAKSGLSRCRVRITVTGGDLNLLAQARATKAGGGEQAPRTGTVLISATPATVYPRAMLETGLAAGISQSRANPFSMDEGHKTLNYWWRLRELGLAAGRDQGEALVFSVTNHLVGGCVSSAILIKDGEAFTPMARGEEGLGKGTVLEAVPGAALPGITRQWAIDELAGEGILTRKQPLTIEDVLNADEVLLTNSSWGVVSVVRVQGQTIADGSAGEIGALLRSRWDRLLSMLAGEKPGGADEGTAG